VKRPSGSFGQAPSQIIAIDEGSPAQHTLIIDARFAVGFREKRLKARHLRIRQPEKVGRDPPLGLRTMNHAPTRISMGPDTRK